MEQEPFFGIRDAFKMLPKHEAGFVNFSMQPHCKRRGRGQQHFLYRCIDYFFINSVVYKMSKK